MSANCISNGSRVLRVLAIAVTVVGSWTATRAAAADPAGTQVVLTCRIAGQNREASVILEGDRATYRYGPPQQNPELTLSNSLANLDYRRQNGPGNTIDEIVTFRNGGTAYRFAAGFREGAGSGSSTLRPFGLLTVDRDGTSLTRLECRPDSIARTPDGLLARLRAIGRERTSDGLSFPNYPIHDPVRAAQSPPCEADFNVDTCWSRGVSASRRGDLGGALEHYDMSCDARITTLGCYEAGKLYLHNRQLRDYARARQRLATTCDGDDTGQGPYACKYIGWMYLTGTGVQRDLDTAFEALAKACFFHNTAILIDPEGCHFLGKAIQARRGHTVRDEDRADYLTYIAFAQACTDNAKTICDDARALHGLADARSAPWIAQCDRDVRRYNRFASCAYMTAPAGDYDTAQRTRRTLASLFRLVSEAVD